MAKTIGSITPIWNAELFIEPHFEMLSKLDRNIVLFNKEPWPTYAKEHYDTQQDASIEMIKRLFPRVEIYETSFTWGADLFNQGLEILKDCDMVFKFDVDMLLTSENWDRLLDFIHNTGYDYYNLDWSTHTINYYADFEHGLKDALEKDPIAVSPKGRFNGIIDYVTDRPYLIDWDDWVIHHFRGWNKPKSVVKGWQDQENFKEAYKNYGPWLSCPEEIRGMFNPVYRDKWLSIFQ